MQEMRFMNKRLVTGGQKVTPAEFVHVLSVHLIFVDGMIGGRFGNFSLMKRRARN